MKETTIENLKNVLELLAEDAPSQAIKERLKSAKDKLNAIKGFQDELNAASEELAKENKINTEVNPDLFAKNYPEISTLANKITALLNDNPMPYNRHSAALSLVIMNIASETMFKVLTTTGSMPEPNENPAIDNVYQLAAAALKNLTWFHESRPEVEQAKKRVDEFMKFMDDLEKVSVKKEKSS